MYCIGEHIRPHLEREDAVTAAHAIFHPALVVEARAVTWVFLGGHLGKRHLVRVVGTMLMQ